MAVAPGAAEGDDTPPVADVAGGDPTAFGPSRPGTPPPCCGCGGGGGDGCDCSPDPTGHAILLSGCLPRYYNATPADGYPACPPTGACSLGCIVPVGGGILQQPYPQFMEVAAGYCYDGSFPVASFVNSTPLAGAYSIPADLTAGAVACSRVFTATGGGGSGCPSGTVAVPGCVDLSWSGRFGRCGVSLLWTKAFSPLTGDTIRAMATVGWGPGYVRLSLWWQVAAPDGFGGYTPFTVVATYADKARAAGDCCTPVRWTPADWVSSAASDYSSGAVYNQLGAPPLTVTVTPGCGPTPDPGGGSGFADDTTTDASADGVTADHGGTTAMSAASPLPLVDRLPCPHRGAKLADAKGCCDDGGSVWACDLFGRVTLTQQPGVVLDNCRDCDQRPGPRGGQANSPESPRRGA